MEEGFSIEPRIGQLLFGHTVANADYHGGGSEFCATLTTSFYLRRRASCDPLRLVLQFDHLQPLVFLDRDYHHNRPTMLFHGHRAGPGRVDQPTEVVLRVPGR